MSAHERPTHIRVVPSPAPGPPRSGRPAPSLVRLVEQSLAARPGGLPWRMLWEELALRERAAGRPAPRRDQVVRVLGDLLVRGRVDERNGRFVLRTQGATPPVRLSA